MVETTSAAQACVELLRRENLGIATFMILVLIPCSLQHKPKILTLSNCFKHLSILDWGKLQYFQSSFWILKTLGLALGCELITLVNGGYVLVALILGNVQQY